MLDRQVLKRFICGNDTNKKRSKMSPCRFCACKYRTFFPIKR